MTASNGSPLLFGLTDHVEGPANRPTAEIFDEVSEYVLEADRLGVEFAWFSEHHAHVHEGHLPSPLLYALHLAGQTSRIRLGTAIICLNLHHPLAVAEQVSVADILAGGRLAVGFGSGSSPEEFGLFDLEVTGEEDRHARFAEALEVILSAWQGSGQFQGRYYCVREHTLLPCTAPDLRERCWQAVAITEKEPSLLDGGLGRINASRALWLGNGKAAQSESRKLLKEYKRI